MTDEINGQRLDAAIRAAMSGTATLFVGAGVSFLSKNEEGKALPNGDGLSDILHDELEIERRKHSLASISDYYRTKKGSASLVNLLKSQFSAAETDQQLINLYRLPWRRIFTTNYDLVIENSQLSKNSQRFSHIDKPRNVSEGSIIHLNGRIENAIPQSLDDDITLTDRSYSLSNLISTGWMSLFLSDLKTSKYIIFIGYSLSDLDIARALIEDPNLYRKTIIFVGPDTDEVELNRVSKFGVVFTEGVDLLFSHHSRAASNYTPLPVTDQLLVCQELNLEKSGRSEPAAELVYNQLVFGAAPLQDILSRESINDADQFLVERSDVTLLLNSDVDKFRDIFVTGEFASGKTFSLLQIAIFALERGGRVFWINDGPELARDLGLIARMEGDIWILCDSYANKIDTLKAYIKQRRLTHKLVLAERTATHELVRSSLEADAAFGPIREVTLSRLDLSEAIGFDSLVNFAGLWGAHAGLSSGSRSKVLLTDLDGSLYRLLIEIIKSRKVQQDIETLLSPLREDDGLMRFFVTALIVKVMGFDFWINDWQHFYSVPDIRNMLRRYGAGINHFINLDSSQLHLRSGIISQFILRNFSSDETILDCLVDMYNCSSNDLFKDDGLSEIAFELRHYNRVEPLFSDKNKLFYLRRYFLEIRSFPRTVNNSDYWLQYGIAMSIHGDLPAAQEAFSTAYAKEKSKDRPNLVKIDNYFARFELELAIYEDDSNAAFALAQSGANKLMKQTLVEANKHYPFKTGRSFSGIAAKHYDHWDERQKASFSLLCSNLKNKALQWRKSSRSANRDVDFLITDMENLESM